MVACQNFLSFKPEYYSRIYHIFSDHILAIVSNADNQDLFEIEINASGQRPVPFPPPPWLKLSVDMN